MFETKMQGEIRELRQNLQTILDEDGGGRVTVFTENRELKELAAQINRLLEEKAKTEADFRCSEIASRKMLSNISHDLKTPLTVIRGYLEIMRTKGEAALAAQAGLGTQAEAGMQTASEMPADLQMLLKAEEKAKALMALIDSFFFIGEAGGGRYADFAFPAGCLRAVSGERA